MKPNLIGKNGFESDSLLTSRTRSGIVIPNSKFLEPNRAVSVLIVNKGYSLCQSGCLLSEKSYKPSISQALSKRKYTQISQGCLSHETNHCDTVINSGLNNVATGGNVTLQGRKLQNQGANLGAINMAAGKQAALTFDNQGLIGISVTKETLHDELGEMPLSNTHMRIAA